MTQRNFGDFRGYQGLRDLIIDYLGGQCLYCQSDNKLSLHHAKPLYAGGTNTMGNLEVVCYKCHRKLHTQMRLVYPHGKQIPRGSLGEMDDSMTVGDKLEIMWSGGMTIEEMSAVLGLSVDVVKELVEHDHTNGHI